MVDAGGASSFSFFLTRVGSLSDSRMANAVDEQKQLINLQKYEAEKREMLAPYQGAPINIKMLRIIFIFYQ